MNARLRILLLTIGIGLVACGGSTPSPEAAPTQADLEIQFAVDSAEAARKRNDLQAAIQWREKALVLATNAYGQGSMVETKALFDLGRAWGDVEHYDRAKLLFEKAYKQSEKLDPPAPRIVASAATTLATSCLDAMDLDCALPLLQRAFEIRMKEYGEKHAVTAETALQFGRYMQYAGQCDGAIRMYELVLPTLEQAYGHNDHRVAEALNGQATCYSNNADYDKAAAIYQDEIAVRRVVWGDTHLQLVSPLTDLASVYTLQRKYAQAEATLKECAAVLEANHVAEDDPGLAKLYHALSSVYFFQNARDPRVEKLGLSALQIQVKAHGGDESYSTGIIDSLRLYYWARKDFERATAMQQRLLNVTDGQLTNALAQGEEQVLATLFYDRLFEMWSVLSLQVQAGSQNQVAAEQALTTLLRRKGRVLEVLGARGSTLRAQLMQSGGGRFDQLLAMFRDEAHRSFRTAIYKEAAPANARDAVQRRVALLEQLEKEVVARGAQVSDDPNVTIQGVATAIPKGSALIELIEYAHFFGAEPDAAVEARYAAFVLKPDGSTGYANLGKAQDIDAAVERLRTDLARANTDPKPAARALDALVMQPLRALLGDTRHVFIAPDGQLALIPLAALVDEEGRYLVERWSFSYLTTGRELLRLAAKRTAPRAESLVIANPDFGRATTAASPTASVLERVHFGALKGSGEEGNIVARMLGARMLSGAQATKDAVASVRGPRVLHIATHGFFLGSASLTERVSRGLELDTTAPAKKRTDDYDAINGLMRAGLVFAGANQRSKTNDGILPANEAAWLDLTGTELVVLSACETGVGRVNSGDGLQGMQRALLWAGARSLVMSLWKVDDEATRDLMVGFYEGLKRKQPRADALRDAQLRMLTSATHRHPYYWAAFVQYGDASPLE